MVGIISDIHGHMDQLQAALDQLRARGVQKIWCLGDTIGSGGRSKECFDLVADSCEIVLAGNHDLAVTGECDVRSFPEWARTAIHDAQNYLLGDERFAQLRPQTVTYMYDVPVRLVHGAPRDPAWGFISGAADAYFAFESCDEQIIVHGHTHKQSWCEGTNWHGRPDQGLAERINFGAKRHLVNPGALSRGEYGILHPDRNGGPGAFEFCATGLAPRPHRSHS